VLCVTGLAVFVEWLVVTPGLGQSLHWACTVGVATNAEITHMPGKAASLSTFIIELSIQFMVSGVRARPYTASKTMPVQIYDEPYGILGNS
jgi:hypothetical protein